MSHLSGSLIRCTVVPLITPSDVIARMLVSLPCVPTNNPDKTLLCRFPFTRYASNGLNHILSPNSTSGLFHFLPCNLWYGVLPSSLMANLERQNVACRTNHVNNGWFGSNFVPNLSSKVDSNALHCLFVSLTPTSAAPFDRLSPVRVSRTTTSIPLALALTSSFKALIEGSPSLFNTTLL